MLSKGIIEELIRTSVIELTYSYVEDGNSIIQLPEEMHVNPDDKALSSTKMFNRNFTRVDRFNVTIGPVVLSHSVKRRDDRTNFRARDYYFDLRETNYEIEILPSETISVCSNERIAVNGGYAAYVIPKLSNADAGILHISSYIDPFWNGVLQDTIHNLTDKPVKLRVCEPYAVVRFYEVKGLYTDDFKNEFPSSSHHYGQNWRDILSGKRDPIRPGKLGLLNRQDETNLDLKSSTEHIGFWNKITNVARNRWREAIFTSAFVSVVAVVQAGKAVLVDVPELKKSIVGIERIVTSDQISVDIPANTFFVTHKIKVARSIKNIRTIWTKEVGTRKLSSTIEVVKTSTGKGSTELIFRIKLANADKTKRFIDISYLLAD